MGNLRTFIHLFLSCPDRVWTLDSSIGDLVTDSLTGPLLILEHISMNVTQETFIDHVDIFIGPR